jgi:hypothetical protein
MPGNWHNMQKLYMKYCVQSCTKTISKPKKDYFIFFYFLYPTSFFQLYVDSLVQGKTKRLGFIQYLPYLQSLLIC